jgi:hypothetical protein
VNERVHPAPGLPRFPPKLTRPDAESTRFATKRVNPDGKRAIPARERAHSTPERGRFGDRTAERSPSSTAHFYLSLTEACRLWQGMSSCVRGKIHWQQFPQRRCQRATQVQNPKTGDYAKRNETPAARRKASLWATRKAANHSKASRRSRISGESRAHAKEDGHANGQAHCLSTFFAPLL